MSTQISAEFKDDELKDFLNKLNSNLKAIDKSKLKQVAARFGVIVYKDIMKHFDEHVGPKEEWASWSDLYRDRQAKLGYSEPGNILRNKGTLRNTFKPSSYRNSSDGLLWYNNALTKDGFPYAAHHDETAKLTRPFMWLSREAFDSIAEIALDALLEGYWG